MRNNARRGLELRKEWKRGGTDAGVRRARQIAAGGDLSQATIRNMKAFFARFGANYDRDYNKEQPDGGPSAFKIAWLLWGGSSARSFANQYATTDEDRSMINRAAPDALSVGDFVTWDSSGGRVYGKIRRIRRDGSINVPDSDFTITGTEDDPAALIMVYRESDDGWSPSGTLVGHKFSTLTKVAERSERHIQKIEETETQIIITFGKSENYEEPEDIDMDLDEAGYGYDKDKDKDGKHRREARATSGLEIRETEDGNINVEGYAAVFESETVIGGKWRESIARGAFRDAVNRDDVVFLINHTGLPLARTRSGTLELSEDDKGLKIRASLDPSDPDVRSIVPKMKRGDLDKMSFAFVPTRQKWSDAEDMPQRTITEAELHDVSIVTTPAYESTSIGIRSALDSLEQHRKRQKRSQAARRLRMKAKLLPK
tara:strand:+ start:1022 stop:2308 length:1287 start_codon:yes stop_codon:yes gene_type:complete